MSQHDFDIATGDANTGITFRAAVNAALQALASQSSGAALPSVAHPFQIAILTSESPAGAYIRNAANTAWVKFGYIDAGTGKLVLFNADNATNATNATNAGNADNATNATNATNAGNADTVDTYHAASLLARANHTGTQDGSTITGTVPNADTVDGYHAASLLATAAFGSWGSYSVNTVYQAATDMIVCALGSGGALGNDYGYTDSSNPPVTVRGQFEYAAGGSNPLSFSFPVKKNDYWRVTGNGITNIYAITK